jgi:hypothetical protein
MFVQIVGAIKSDIDEPKSKPSIGNSFTPKEVIFSVELVGNFEMVKHSFDESITDFSTSFDDCQMPERDRSKFISVSYEGDLVFI